MLTSRARGRSQWFIVSLGIVALVGLVLHNAPDAWAAKDTLVVVIPSDIESMDPHLAGGLSMRVWANVYEPLLSRGPKGELEPRLAESWKQVDATHYQFKIRSGVKFTSGNPVNAAVLAGIFLEKNDPKNPHTHVAHTSWIKNAQALDEYTLMIETNKPFAPAIFYLAHPMPGALYDMKARKEWGNLKTRSAGTGPYMLDRIEPGQYVQLKRNPDYWGPKPKTEYLRFRVIPEEATRVLALKRGEVDVVLDLGPDAMTQLKDDANVETKVSRDYRVNTLEYNFLQPLIKNNPPVREAIRLAIDKRSIAKNIIGIKGDPADSVVLDISWGYTSVPECIEYNPQRAKQILDSNGWKVGPDGIREKGGEKLNLGLATDYTRDYRNRDVVQAIQGYLREVGIGVELKVLERGPFVDMVIQKGTGYHLNIMGWGGPTNEASWYIFTRLHSANQDLGAWGTTRNRMTSLDQMIDQARSETNETKAIPMWHEIQRTICKDSLMVPLYFVNGIQAVRRNVTGLVTHPDEWYGYRFVNATVN